MAPRSGILLLALMVCLGDAAAQRSGSEGFSPGSAGPGQDLDSTHGRVGIDICASDAQGNAVTGLKQSDFKLLDEGQPMPLVSFAASTAGGPAPGDPPVSVILVLDDADLSGASFAEVESDAEAFLRRNHGRLSHPVTIYRVTSDKLYASIQYSSDGNAMADMLASGMGMRAVWKGPTIQIVRGPANEIELTTETPSGAVLPSESYHSVPLPNALKALGTIALEQRRVPGRKLLFWIGPGWRANLKADKEIFDTITEMSTRLREARIELSTANRWAEEKADARFVLTDEQVHQYASGVSGAQDANYDNLALQVLALRSGGEMLTTNDELIATGQPERNNIPRLIAEHIAEASDYYRLTFDPPRTNSVDEYHKIEVELTPPGLTAHTTAGYYDEPVFYDQPTPASDHVTVMQLERRMAGERSDRKLAGELASLRLTERFSTPRLEEWLKRMPGERSREALTAVADSSVFLPPPADDVLDMPAPDLAAQRAMLSRVANFVVGQAPRMPNFYAERTTIQFGEPMPKHGQSWKTEQLDRNLHFERMTAERIYFEDGKETTDQQKLKVKPSFQEDLLQTTGTFGPILVLMLKAAIAPGATLTWNRWEKGPNGPIALFDYASPAATWTYNVGFCCLAVDAGMVEFRRQVPFHGEFAVDPITGHILRLTVQADLHPRLPLKNSNIMVEYGPIEMGEQTYYCPVRSVSVSRQRRVWAINEWGTVFKVYGSFKTVLNDVTFARYHLFRSETTILPGFVPVPQSQ